MSTLKVRFGAYSTKGEKQENQDALAAYAGQGAALDTKGVVATIADGVSTSEFSKDAATTCATMFINDYFQTADSWSVERSAASIIQSLNAWCCAQDGPQLGARPNCGNYMTTFSSVVIRARQARIFHVGDSRIYRYRDGELEQLTRDHKQYQGGRSYLTRAIGVDQHIDVDCVNEDLVEGDFLVLTTDGVHDFISDKDLSEHLARTHTCLESKAKDIVAYALEGGSDDNLSCLIVSVDELPALGEDQFYRAAMNLVIPPPLSVGNTLEDYKVQEILFEGTRSYVYRVVCTKTKNSYALKTPTQYHKDDASFLRGFAQEQWVGMSIDHENVMKILPRKEGTQFLYHVCELIEGQTLRQWMLDNPLPSLDQVRGILIPVVSALRKVQRLDMVHRDLKPENIMITRDGQVKLVDFGSIRVASIDQVLRGRGGEVFGDDSPQGSFNYIAPETLLNNVSNHTSDLFSLGVIAYEMLSNTLPFKPFPYKDYVPSSLSAWSYKPLCRTKAQLPNWVDLAIRKACAPNNELRYDAYSEFIKDLTTPNEAHIKAVKNAPLLEKNPLMFWQVSAVGLLVLNLIQLVLYLA